MSTIGPKKVEDDIFWDRVPIASSATNVADIIRKFQFANVDTTLMSDDEKAFVKHIKEKSGVRIALLTILPFVGNAIVGLWDYMHPRKIEPDDFKPVDPATLTKEWKVPQGPIDLSTIKKSWDRKFITFTDANRNSISVEVPQTLLQSLKLSPPEREWKDPSKYVELYRDENNTLKMRRISKQHYGKVKIEKFPDKTGTMTFDQFKAEPGDQSHILTLQTQKSLTFFNDRTKKYVKIPFDTGYKSHTFTPKGLQVFFEVAPKIEKVTKAVDRYDPTTLVKKWDPKSRTIEFAYENFKKTMPVPNNLLELLYETYSDHNLDPSKYLEVYRATPEGFDALRLIEESHFTEGHLKNFKGSDKDQSHLLFVNKNRLITILNDRTKEYVHIAVPLLEEYAGYTFNRSGLVRIKFKPRTTWEQ